MNPIKKYIDITSSHRDRTRYPNPADFEVRLSNSSSQITDASAISAMNYPPPTRPTVLPSQYETFGYMYAPIPADSSVPLMPLTTTINLEHTWIDTNGNVSALHLRPFDNAYVGDYLEYVERNVANVSNAVPQYRRIISDSYLLDQVIGECKVLAVPSSFELRLDTTPALPPYLANYLVGKTIKIISGNANDEERTIVWYRQEDATIWLDAPIDNPSVAVGDFLAILSSIHQVVIDSPFTQTIPAWPATQYAADTFPSYARFRIRESIPVSWGTVSSVVNNNTIILSTNVSISPVGSWLWDTEPFIWVTATVSAISGGTLSVTPVPLQPSGFFNDMYVSAPSLTAQALDDAFRIIAWDGASFALNPPNVSPATIAPGAVVNIFQYTPSRYSMITAYTQSTNEISVSPPFSLLPRATDFYNILTVVNNEVDLNYTGSTVSQQQPHCYAIELVSITLPNTILQSGSRAIYYPYFYVAFYSVTMGGPGQTLIYSNNPASNSALFKVPSIYQDFVVARPFISLDGHGMVQTIKFKPNDNFRFTVFLPNGEVFATKDIDYYQPAPPNDLVQISATFSISRLGND